MQQADGVPYLMPETPQKPGRNSQHTLSSPPQLAEAHTVPGRPVSDTLYVQVTKTGESCNYDDRYSMPKCTSCSVSYESDGCAARAFTSGPHMQVALIQEHAVLVVVAVPCFSQLLMLLYKQLAKRLMTEQIRAGENETLTIAGCKYVECSVF